MSYKPNPFIVPKPITKKWYEKIYLTSNWWRWRRDGYLKRVGYRCECEYCGRWATELHHLSYDRLFAELNEDLMALCQDCHRRMHKWPFAANDNEQLTFLFDALDQKKKSDTG